jgi:putative transposase
MRKAYATDITDGEWEIVRVHVASKWSKGKRGREPKEDKREVVNAIFYVLQTGCSWRMLPHDFPDWQNVYWYFQEWNRTGVTEKLHDFLRAEVREKAGKKSDPTVGIGDSQSVKTTEKGGSKDMMVGKRSKGENAISWLIRSVLS